MLEIAPSFKRLVNFNAWLIPLMAAFLLTDKTRGIFVENFYLISIIVVFFEVIFYILKFSAIEESESDKYLDKKGVSWDIEYCELRFCTLEDDEGTLEIYNSWFPPSVSMDDDEYDKIIERGQFVRVAEAHLKRGSSKQVKIVGYYSLFCLSKNTYDKLRRGAIKEKDLKSDDVLDIDDRQAFVIYIPEICESKDVNVGQILVRDLIRYAFYALNKNENIQFFAAWPFTKYGKRFVQTLKMQKAPGRFFFQRLYCLSRRSAVSKPQPSGEFKPRRRITF
jgi:hypothetical protein